VRQFDDFQIEKLFVGDIKIKCHYCFFHTSSLERKKKSLKSVFKPKVRVTTVSFSLTIFENVF
jgi:hypothetical protein